MLRSMQPDSIVVAGGQSRRLGGIDKTMLVLRSDGLTLLQGVIDACVGRVIVVGQQREVSREVTWVSDEFPHGGPASGLWSGLPHVTTEYVFISAADQLLSPTDVAAICQASVGHDGAWAIRADGMGQPLCACVRTEVLRELLEPSRGINASPLRLLETRNMVPVSVSELVDVDTWNDVARMAEREGVQLMELWLERLGQVLDIPVADIPIDDLLDLTRDVAHNVERRAAPLTTFLIGLATSDGKRDVNEVMAAIRIALDEWKPSGQ
ncbi:MAG: NTP transferase domain-containing protein [Actinobacteria bacterium]|uniref:Unannotated protein n=1 Tax=freshwater metagenome TaxID=449393 RepID=A0A6J5ZPX2_9ZZZZ|nr:NTP transferase domain-containing protein [Actinomycetota bacterium]